MNAAVRFITPLRRLLDEFRKVIERGLPVGELQKRLDSIVAAEYTALTKQLDKLAKSQLGNLDKKMREACCRGPSAAVLAVEC